jgi:FkbM family methyltransferase
VKSLRNSLWILLRWLALDESVKRSRIYNAYLNAAMLLSLLQTASRKGMQIRLRKYERRRVISIQNGQREIRMPKGHLLYCFDMVDSFDYYFGAVIPVFENAIAVADYSQPHLHTLASINVPFFFTSLAEPQETTDLYIQRADLSKGDIVLDLGAYCGTSTWAFSRQVGETGKVLAFEPDARNYEALCRNIKLHKLTNVTAINKGVWSSTTKLLFNHDGTMGSAISTVLHRQTNAVEIDVISLRDAINQYQLPHVDFIKMDIEGSEVEVLRSSVDLLRTLGATIVVEPHFVDGALATDRVCELLRSANYKVQIIPQADLTYPLVFAQPADA